MHEARTLIKMPMAVAVSGVMWATSPATGCGESRTRQVCVDTLDVTNAFDDHTVGCMADVDAFATLAGTRVGTSVVKFDVMAFSDPDRRHARFLDSNFYSLHDEWYYYRLLNGERFEGDAETEPYDGHFDSIPAIYTWAWVTDQLPVGLAWSGERLYARRFYDMAFAADRYVGPGTLIHMPDVDLDASGTGLWAFELEHSDDLPYQELVVYFETLHDTTPPEIGEAARWLVRSTEQEALAQHMEDDGLPYADRILRYDELVEPGTTQVYNEGITAGRLKIVRAGESLVLNRDDHVLVLEELPDQLPPARALITSVPQTPLAHINLLARSRGIPNASVGGVSNDPAIDALARVSTRVAVLARDNEPLRIVQMTKDEYAYWESLREVVPKFVPPVDFPSAPYTIDLASLTPSEAADLRPLIGGKAAGMVELIAATDIDIPDLPFCITARAYAEHVAEFGSIVEAMLETREFRTERYRSLRFLVLEGEPAYDALYPSPLAQREKHELLDDTSVANVLPKIVAAGGLRTMISERPLESATLAELETALHEQFESFSATQGLRFRSSSSVEDIDGFNGAGLYASHTGFLDPLAQPHAKDQIRTIAAALQSTWASYWGAEAFEERMLAKVDHQSGNMAVLVHARFDNDMELANGVITLTRFPGGNQGRYEMQLNSQRGDVSVTNPDTHHLAEVVHVISYGSAIESVEYKQLSTVPPLDTPILSQPDIQNLLEQTQRVTDAWLTTINEQWPSAQAQRALVLDFEFRRMSGEWPAFASGEDTHERIVIKQARTLDPDTGRLPESVVGLDFPRDVLARAASVERRSCKTSHFELTVEETLTDSFLPPDLGHAQDAFVARVSIIPTTAIEGFALEVGEPVETNHLDFQYAAHPGLGDNGPWTLAIELAADTAQAVGFARLEVLDEHRWRLTGQDGTQAQGQLIECTPILLYATPDLYLHHIIAHDTATP